MPLGFDVEAYVQDALMIMRGRRIDVELLFSKKVAPWVKDKLWHNQPGDVFHERSAIEDDSRSSRHGRAYRLDRELWQPGQGGSAGMHLRVKDEARKIAGLKG